MSESDDDLIIDIDYGKKHELKDIYDPVPSTSSYSDTKIKNHDNDSDDENFKISHDLTEDTAGILSDLSDESDSKIGDLCAICLGHIKGDIGSPDAAGCEHFFCLLCILEWAKNNPVCPQDRRPFEKVLVKEHVGGSVISEINNVKDVVKEEDTFVETLTFCEVCGSCDREDCLLLCDGCDLGYHLDCLTPSLSEVPIEEWFCPMCTAADLPLIVGQENASQNRSKASQESPVIKKKEKIKSQPRPRMIPRTRASERVLQRISQTRKKEGKKKKKKAVQSVDSEDEKSEENFKKDRHGIVQAFARHKPFGSINDNDIDAVFNEDEYADKLLSGTSPLNLRINKMIACDKLRNCAPNKPVPSYSGRAVHPKINEISQSSSSTDILTNILENQFVLLSNSKDISLTEERKFTRKDGKKPIEFDVDRENNLMSKPLPSQRNASESGSGDQSQQSDSGNLDETSSENISESHKKTDNEHKETALKYHSSRSHHTSSKTQGYRPSTSQSHYFKSKDSYSSSRNRYDYDKAYSSWRRDSGRRRRDRSRSRSRSRSRDRDRERNRYRGERERVRDKYRSRDRKKFDYRPRFHSPRSSERERRDYKSRRHSRTPERYFRNKKVYDRPSKSLTARLFGGSSLVEQSSKETTEIPGTDASQTQAYSLHTMRVPSPTEQSSSNKLFDKSLNSIDLKHLSEIETDDHHSSTHSSESRKSPLASAIDCQLQSISDSIEKEDPETSGVKNTLRQDPILLPLKPKTNYESDSEKGDVVEAKKRKLKQLFGDDNSEFGSPASTDTKFFNPDDSSMPNKSVHSEEGIKKKADSIKSLLDHKQKEVWNDSENVSIDSVSASAFLGIKKASAPLSEASEDVFEMKEPNFESSSEFSFPSNLRTLSSEEELQEITVLSQTSRDLILNSLFGKGNTPNDDSVKPADKLETHKSESHREKAVLQSPPAKKIEKNPTKDSTLDKNGSCKNNAKNKSQNRKEEIFANLFGDMSDPEVSDNESIDKTAKKSDGGRRSTSSVPKKEVQSKLISEKHTDERCESRKETVEIPKVEPHNKKTEKEDKQNRERSHTEKNTLKEGLQVNGAKDATCISKSKTNRLFLEVKVVEEAKRFLNPHYLDKGFSKEVYKEIISKCVNKVLEVECGNTVEPKKIQKLVDGYVHVYHHRNKKNNTMENSSNKT